MSPLPSLLVLACLVLLSFPGRAALCYPTREPIRVLHERELELIPGVGPWLSQSLKEHQDQPMESAPGIGPHRLSVLSRYLVPPDPWH
ncbi:MAG: hypothetical protein HQL31_01565 [Planctomycetes bacterium]|nr:hypothetical protein [Planctomycetota bacterium]